MELLDKNRTTLKIFLCHSSNDKPKVKEIYQRLKNEGFQPWLDEEDLIPGMNWQKEIPKAVKKSDIILVCLSNSSVSKTGYVQKEIRFALDVALEQPEGTIFIIPLRLEDCEVPEALSEWHWVDYYKEDGYRKLRKALLHRSKDLNIQLSPAVANENTEHDTKFLSTTINNELIMPESTLVILLGSSIYTDERLNGLEQAMNNVIIMKHLFQRHFRITDENILKILNPSLAQDVLTAIERKLKEKKFESVIFYYSGHGVFDTKGFQYYLATKETNLDTIAETAISLKSIARSINKANTKIIFILDACFSGAVMSELYFLKSFCLLASSSYNEVSRYFPNQDLTSFTKEFIHVIESGIAVNKRNLTLNDIHKFIRVRMEENRLPIPICVSGNGLSDYSFAKNKTYNSSPS